MFDQKTNRQAATQLNKNEKKNAGVNCIPELETVPWSPHANSVNTKQLLQDTFPYFALGQAYVSPYVELCICSWLASVYGNLPKHRNKSFTVIIQNDTGLIYLTTMVMNKEFCFKLL